MYILSSLFAVLVFSTVAIRDTGQRKILLFAAESTDRSLLDQQVIFAKDPTGLKERQIVVSVITPATNKTAFDSFHQKGNAFIFVLYGKDGGEKYRSASPVSLEKLYGIIDGMPMRKAEMKSGERK